MRRPGDVEGDVLGTSWETLFADWVDSQHPIMVHFIIYCEKKKMFFCSHKKLQQGFCANPRPLPLYIYQ